MPFNFLHSAVRRRPPPLTHLKEDLDAGLLPCFVCASIGTTSSCAVDPVAELAEVAKR